MSLVVNQGYHGQVRRVFTLYTLLIELNYLTNNLLRCRTTLKGLIKPELVVKVFFISFCIIYLLKVYQEPNEPRKHVEVTASKRLPQAIIIGSRKSGTRALLRFLELNPRVKTAQNEVHFFDRNYDRGSGWYREQMPNSNPGDVVIEKSPAYFVTENVPERIKLMNSSIKLILILRDPVYRLISDFSQLIANRIASRHPDYTPEERELIYEQSKLAFERYALRPDGSINDQRSAIKISSYSLYLERWLSFFSKQQIHLVDGENLILNPHQEMKKVETFLGLEARIKVDDFVYNPDKGFFCIVANHSEARHDSIILQNGNKIRCLGKSKGRRQIKVGQALMGKLRSYYHPFNEYLYTIVGKNLGWQ